MPCSSPSRARSCLLLLACLIFAGAADDDEEAPKPDPTEPGIIARFEDEQGGRVERVEALPRLFGRPGDAPHPRISADRFCARWSGVLVVPREGTYTFTALRSSLVDLRIQVGEKPVALGQAIALAAGNLPITIEGTQDGGEPAFELWWRGEDFADEPIPPRSFRHETSAVRAEILASLKVADRGAVLAETMACFRCHEGPEGWARSLAGDPAASSSLLPGPSLQGLGARVHEGWVLDKISRPHRAPGDRMPALFGDGPGEKLAARVIAAYLTRDDPKATPPGDPKAGEAAYRAAGCVACHAPGPRAAGADADLVSPAPTLDHLAEKWTGAGLAEFLREPLATRPHGRMPDFGLSATLAADLAAFLLSGDRAGKAPRDEPDDPIRDEELTDLWKSLGFGPEVLDAIERPKRIGAVALRLMAARQCLNCHDVDAEGEFRLERRPSGFPSLTFEMSEVRPSAPPALRDLAEVQAGRGCLAPTGMPTGKAPRFDLTDGERETVRAHALGMRTESSPSTAEVLRIGLATLNCVRCHSNEGAGGAALLESLGGDDEAKHRLPPRLDGAGDRVRPGRLAQWLSAGARDEALRPWAGARMPGFGLRGVLLAENLGRRDGAVGSPLANGPTAPVVCPPEIRAEDVQLGRFLAGSRALGCINCHAFQGHYLAGQPDPTTRGVDLTRVGEHLRPEYFRRWMMDPARIRPETKMPKTILADGSVPIPDLAHLPAGTPLTAFWSYLNQGTSALPPAEEPSILPTPNADRPVVQRGDTKADPAERIPKGISLGFADGTLLFDADKLAPVAVWEGGFVKGVSQAYYGMGWEAEGGKVVALDAPPGAIAFQLEPEGEWLVSPRPLESDLNQGSRFEGYRIGKSAVRLRYRLLAGTNPVSVVEDVRVEGRPGWHGFARRLRFSGLPDGARVALLAPEGGGYLPRTAEGKEAKGETDATHAPLLTFKMGDSSRALRVAAPAGSTWIGDGGTSRLALPAAKAGDPIEVELDWWAYRGPNPEPAAAELAGLVSKGPAIVDRFDDPIEKGAPVKLDDPSLAEVPKDPSRTRVANRPPVKHEENLDDFPPVLAKAVRFTITATDNGQAPAFDELEIYGADPKVNLALKGVASASSTIQGYPIHRVEHLNDGKLGNNFSWVGGENAEAWVRFDLPERVAVQKVVWARDRTGSQKDRLATGYRIEVSTDGLAWTKVSDQSTRNATHPDVSPGYELELIPAPFQGCRPSDVAFGPDGMMYAVAMTEGQVYRSPIPPPGRPDAVRWSRFAGGLNHPVGIEVVGGRVFVSQKPEITELIDLDGDGVVDDYRTAATGWGLSRDGWHEYCFGLADDGQGHLYFALTTGRFWTHLGNYVFPGRYRGSILRVGVSDGKIEVVANGCRVPNGITRGPDHQIYFTDNQGDWIQACKLARVVEGRFYGHPETVDDPLPKDQFPTGLSSVWLPYQYSRSASGPVFDTTDGKFGPFAGQFFVGDAGYGANPGLVRVAMETVDGEDQGAVFRFAEEEPHGSCRLKFGPDGRLYLASLTTGLARLRTTGATPFAFHSMKIREAGKGFDLKLTKPLAADADLKPADFRMRRYHFVYSGNYGSTQADDTPMTVEDIAISDDRTTITLTLPIETHPLGMIYELAAPRLKSADGDTLRHNEAWYTVHKIPRAR